MWAVETCTRFDSQHRISAEENYYFRMRWRNVVDRRLQPHVSDLFYFGPLFITAHFAWAQTESKKKMQKKDDAKLESSTPWARRRHNCTHSARIDFHFYFFSFRCLGSSRAAIFSVRFFHSRVWRTEHISPHVSHQCQPTCRVCMSLSMRSVHNLVVRKFSARHRLRIYS